MEYTLKEFAELFGITEHTVRYYTDIDLLPCRRDGQNRRGCGGSCIGSDAARRLR